jgi:AcrR family transcriptional regulator
MGKLRMQKKSYTREKILQSAKEVFLEKGYVNTKTIEISQKAGIGEGTLFNYFPTKSELFLASFISSMSSENKHLINIDVIDKYSISSGISCYIGEFLIQFAEVDKKILRDYFGVIYNFQHDENESTSKSLLYLDESIISVISSFFNKLIEDNFVSSDFEIDTAVYSIYGCVSLQFTLYVYDEKMTYESMFSNIKKQVSFILNGNL